MNTTDFRMKQILPWLKAKKATYEAEGLIPTLDLVIADLEKEV